VTSAETCNTGSAKLASTRTSEPSAAAVMSSTCPSAVLKQVSQPSLPMSPPPTLSTIRRGAPPSAGISQIVPCISPGVAGEK